MCPQQAERVYPVNRGLRMSNSPRQLANTTNTGAPNRMDVTMG